MPATTEAKARKTGTRRRNKADVQPQAEPQSTAPAETEVPEAKARKTGTRRRNKADVEPQAEPAGTEVTETAPKAEAAETDMIEPAAEAEAKPEPQAAEPVAEPEAAAEPEAEAETAGPEPGTLVEVKAERPAEVSFRVDRADFAQAVAWVAKSLPVRPSVPVLTGIRIDVIRDRMELCAYDYESSAKAALPVDGDGEVSLLLPGKILSEITNALPHRMVDIDVKGTKVVMTSGDAVFTLMSMPVEDYPTLPKAPQAVGTVDAAEFAKAVAQVAVAASKDDTLAMLGGVHVTADGGKLTLATTDRYRLTVRELAWTPPTPDFTAEIMIPARTLSPTAKAFTGDGMVELAFPGEGDEAGLAGLAAGDRHTTTRLLDPQFIDYQNLLPTEFCNEVDVSVAALTAAVKRVALVAERETPIRLAFDSGWVRIEAGTGDEAHGVEKLPVEWSGDRFEVAFNHRYLLDALDVVGSPKARLRLTSATTAELLVPVNAGGEIDPAYVHLLMPIRLS
ncbi:DNA polymerase III subunit beta [Planotetraspora sp. GP83]|uniref:DNA polymerase III subunit beta n=1 Tax=Planotetraspora sp. GP83 TaxID=3156264 RepID=UPI003516CE20